ENARILKDFEARKIKFSQVAYFFGLLAAERWHRAFEQVCHDVQIAAALRKRVNQLTEPAGPLGKLDREVGEQHQKGDNDRNVDIGNPVPVVEQRTPDAPEGRTL